jgi:SAM-dependent methyltransferase
MNVVTVKFRPDTRLRAKLFVPEAMSHPAKANLHMMLEIVERYTEPGQLILDPMAGAGSTMTAALMGRNVVCVDLETHFVEPMRASWEKMKRNPMMGFQMGEVTIIQGDARDLGDLLVDAAVFSPPWEDNLPNHTSPEHKTDFSRIKGIRHSQEGYTRPDAAVFSPPFHDTANKSESGGEVDHFRATGNWRTGLKYSADAENIGNQRGDAYWDSMKLVYAECLRILKPGGVMALVLKGFTREGEYIDLPAQTGQVCEALGFTQLDHWRRELWSLSFWRILQQRRDPEAFDERLRYEEVLAFRKGETDGDDEHGDYTQRRHGGGGVSPSLEAVA